MSKHTPGPWRLDEIFTQELVTEGYHFIDAGRGHSLEGFGLSGFLSLADARLIAAAPDLLEACKEWVEIDGPTVSLEHQRARWQGVVAKMKAAIAKAEGNE